MRMKPHESFYLNFKIEMRKSVGEKWKNALEMEIYAMAGTNCNKKRKKHRTKISRSKVVMKSHAMTSPLVI